VTADFRRLSKSGSVPNLNEKARITSPLLKSSSPRRTSRHHHHHHGFKHSSMSHRSSRENGYLHPGLLRYHRHAISVDETSPLRHLTDSTHGSQVSVTFDPTPEIIDIVPVHRKRLSKRSDTSRKHVLSRQMPIEKEDLHNARRRSSTMSDNSTMGDNNIEHRRASTASRTYSIDSRYTQNSTNDLCKSPDKQHSPGKVSSIISMDKEFRLVGKN
jgi:hypothetical protein